MLSRERLGVVAGLVLYNGAGPLGAGPNGGGFGIPRRAYGEAHEDTSKEEDEVGEEDGEGDLQRLQHAHHVAVAALDEVAGAHAVEECNVLLVRGGEGSGEM